MNQIFGIKMTSACLILALAGAAACGPAEEFDSCEEQSNCSDEGAAPWNDAAAGAAGEASTNEGGAGGRKGSGGSSSGGENAGGGAAAASSGGDSLPHVDHWPPRVISVTPENTARGVDANSTIVFIFDEPMDRGATEAALQPINIDSYTTEWNETSTELKITPESLELAAGSDPEVVVANLHGARISTTARDRAGNPLQMAAETTFSTLRRITTVASRKTQVVYSDGQLLPCGYMGAHYQTAGDDATGVYRRSLLTLDASLWPAGATRVESMILRTEQLFMSGQPFGASGLGVFVADGLADGLTPGLVALDAPPSMRIGVLSDLAKLGAREIDIAPFLEEAYAAGDGGERLLRLGFEKNSNNNGVNDWMQFTCELEIETTYLLP